MIDLDRLDEGLERAMTDELRTLRGIEPAWTGSRTREEAPDSPKMVVTDDWDVDDVWDGPPLAPDVDAPLAANVDAPLAPDVDAPLAANVDAPLAPNVDAPSERPPAAAPPAPPAPPKVAAKAPRPLTADVGF